MSFLGRNPEDDDNAFEFRVLNEIYEDSEHPFAELDGQTFDSIERMKDASAVASEFVTRVKGYPCTIVQLSKSAADQEFNLQFARLNLGTIINSGEKLHAMVGELRDICFDKVGQHVFLQNAQVRTTRYSKEQLAAQIIAQVFSLEQGTRAGRNEFDRTRHFDIQKLFKKHTKLSDEHRGWVAGACRIMDLLHPAFDQRGALRSRAIVVSTILLAYQENIQSAEDAQLVAEFVDEFVRCLKWQLGKGVDIDGEYRYLIDFQRHVTQASVEKSAVAARAETFREGLALWRRSKKLPGDAEYMSRLPERDPRRERQG